MIDRMRVGALLALLLGVITVVAVSLSVESLAVISIGPRDDPLWWFPIVGAFFFLVPGLVVLQRTDWHPVGWLLVNLAFGFPLSFAPDSVTFVDLNTVERWWLWLSNISVSAVFWSVWCALILVFPDGFTRRRGLGRLVAFSILAMNAIAVLLTAFQETLGGPGSSGVPSPMPFAIVPHTVGQTAALVPNMLVLVAVVDFVSRFRRSAGPARSQYRWVVWSFILLVASLVLAMIGSIIVGDLLAPAWLLVVLAYLLVPVAFMVAILRYRLYDIDRVVSRTITYGAVALIVGLVYAIPVLGIARLVGETNALLVAGSTLAAAAAFNPARKAVHRAVEHRFNRSHYDFAHEVDTFSDRLRSELSLEAVIEAVDDVVIRTLQPAGTAMWLRGPSA